MVQVTGAANQLMNILARCEGAYARCTIKGYAADQRVFIRWCDQRSAPWLPSSPGTVAAFVDDQVDHHRIATIKRRLCAIAFAHRMCDLPPPTLSQEVRLAVRRAARKRASRPHQKRGLTHAIRARLVEGLSGNAGRRA